MDFWVTFWTGLLAVSLTVFLGLAIVVSVGGVSDIRSLFKTLGGRKPDQFD
jgi:hypothetical protein